MVAKRQPQQIGGKKLFGNGRKIAIPIVVFVVAFFFLLGIFYFSEKKLEVAAEVDLREIGQKILLNTERFLDPTGFIVDSNASWLESMLGRAGFALGFHKIARVQMAEYSHLNLIYFGDNRGNHWSTKKERDGTIRMRVITRLDDSPASRETLLQASRLSMESLAGKESIRQQIAPIVKTAWYDLDPAGSLRPNELDPFKIYDPRLRPWYLGAEKLGGRFWSNVYTWEDKYHGKVSRQAGITVSTPVYWLGQMVGVTAVDLFLQSISDFLGELKISPFGRAFIFDSHGLVVGLPNFEELMQSSAEGKGDVQQIHISQVKDKAKIAAFQHLRDQLRIPDGQPVGQFTAQIVRFSAQKEKFFSFFKPLDLSYQLDWYVAVLIPEEDIKGPLREKFRWILIAFVILSLLLFALIPLYIQVERERRFIRAAFSKYVSPNRVEFLLKNPEQLSLGGEYRDCSFVMTDLSRFTSLMEKVGDKASPERIVTILNDYLEGMVNIAFHHEGTLDRIVGDAVAVLFSAPVVQEDHAQRALECALAMDRFANEFSQKCQRQGIPFGHTRIGVNSGRVLLGNFGGKAVFDYRALGDPVNIAARLESINDQIGTLMCVSEETVRRLVRFYGRPVGVLVLKGKEKGVQVYEPIAEKILESAHMQTYMHIYQQMKNADPGAEAAFAQALQQWPDDPLLRFHHARLLDGERGDTITFLKK